MSRNVVLFFASLGFLFIICLVSPNADAYTTPTGVDWDLNDLVMNSGGVVTSNFDEFYIHDNTTISSFSILHIASGSILYFDHGTSLIIEGNLDAIGTSSNIIVLTSNSTIPAPGDWDSLILRTVHQNDTALSNISVEYSRGSIHVIDSGNLTFTNLLISNASEFGVIYENCTNMTLLDCAFFDIDGYALAITDSSYSIDIRQCTFENIEGTAVSLSNGVNLVRFQDISLENYTSGISIIIGCKRIIFNRTELGPNESSGIFIRQGCDEIQFSNLLMKNGSSSIRVLNDCSVELIDMTSFSKYNPTIGHIYCSGNSNIIGRNVILYEGSYGLYAGSSKILLDGFEINGTLEYGIRCVDSLIELRNGLISSSVFPEIEATTGGLVRLYNVSTDGGWRIPDLGSKIEVYWYLDVELIDGLGGGVDEATVHAVDPTNDINETRYTDADARIISWPLLENVTTRDGEELSVASYGIIATRDWLVNTTAIYSGMNQRVVMELWDRVSPVANFSVDEVHRQDSRIPLDAKNSTDNDPSLLETGNFTWTLEGESYEETLHGARANLSLAEMGEYTITLRVVDAAGNEDILSRTIQIIDGLPPTPKDTIYHLNLSLEVLMFEFNWTWWEDNDPQFPEGGNFSWTFVMGDVLIVEYGQQVLVVFPEPGIYAVTFAATDANGNVGTHEFDLNLTIIEPVDITSPIADAGSDRSILINDMVELDGSLSSDDVEVVNWTWKLLSPPNMVLYGPRVTIVPDSVGVWAFELTVLDSAGNLDTDFVNITVEPHPPTITVTEQPGASPVKGTFNVSGNASGDIPVQKVEYQIDSGPWDLANGSESWVITVSSTTLTNEEHVMTVRAWDGFNYSAKVDVTFQVDNPKPHNGNGDDGGFPIWIILVVIMVVVLLIIVIAKLRRP